MQGFRSYKLLYYNNQLSIETIKEGLLNIVNSQIKEGEVYVVLIEIGYGGTYYSVSKALFLTDEESVESALGLVANTLELLKVKYNLEGQLHLAIKGRVFINTDTYIELKDSQFRKEVMKKLDKIQKEYNASTKTSGNSVKTLLDKVVDMSKAVSTNNTDGSMLYLHNSVYSLISKRDYITSIEYIDNTIKDSNYSKSTKIKVGKTGITYEFVDHHYTDGTIKREFKGNIFI
jgi:HD superfamily phosphohydrolase